MIRKLFRWLGADKPAVTGSLVLRHAARSDVGRVRTNNEDRWLADPELQLYLVADGMGGQMAGDVASRIVAEVLPARLRTQLGRGADLAQPETTERVLETVRELSRNLYRETAGQPGLAGMGATVALLLVHGVQALVVHLGDSRVYRDRQGELQCLTTDHTLAQLLIQAGVLTPDQASSHPARHQLRRFVGMPGEPLPEARLVDLVPEDRFLLCTDGLTSMVPAAQVGRVLSQGGDLEQVAASLIQAANAAGGQDNVTVLLVEVAGRRLP